MKNVVVAMHLAIEPPGACPFRLKLRPPFRFAFVENGIYRGSFPRSQNHAFIGRLRLKTLVSLIPDDIPAEDEKELEEFCRLNDVNQVRLSVERPKDHVPLTLDQVTQVLNIIINPQNHPVYVHCLTGSVVTGLIMMCLRKLQLWDFGCASLEYTRFIREGVISNDESDFVKQYCNLSNHSVVYSLQLTNQTDEQSPSNIRVTSIASPSSSIPDLVIPDNIPMWLWGGNLPAYLLKSLHVSSVSISPILLTQKEKETNAHSSIANININLSIQHPRIRCTLKSPKQLEILLTKCMEILQSSNGLPPDSKFATLYHNINHLANILASTTTSGGMTSNLTSATAGIQSLDSSSSSGQGVPVFKADRPKESLSRRDLMKSSMEQLHDDDDSVSLTVQALALEGL